MTIGQLATYAATFLCGVLIGVWLIYDAVLDTIRSYNILIVKKRRPASDEAQR